MPWTTPSRYVDAKENASEVKEAVEKELLIISDFLTVPLLPGEEEGETTVTGAGSWKSQAEVHHLSITWWKRLGIRIGGNTPVEWLVRAIMLIVFVLSLVFLCFVLSQEVSMCEGAFSSSASLYLLLFCDLVMLVLGVRLIHIILSAGIIIPANVVWILVLVTQFVTINLWFLGDYISVADAECGWLVPHIIALRFVFSCIRISVLFLFYAYTDLSLPLIRIIVSVIGTVIAMVPILVFASQWIFTPCPFAIVYREVPNVQCTARSNWEDSCSVHAYTAEQLFENSKSSICPFVSAHVFPSTVLGLIELCAMAWLCTFLLRESLRTTKRDRNLRLFFLALAFFTLSVVVILQFTVIPLLTSYNPSFSFSYEIISLILEVAGNIGLILSASGLIFGSIGFEIQNLLSPHSASRVPAVMCFAFLSVASLILVVRLVYTESERHQLHR
mgnify:CR=1 FL=1